MWWRNTRIYLDYASATPVLPEAQAAVNRASALFGNPGAVHTEAVAAKALLEKSRERVAMQLGCKAREVVFTSGLTEANNLAILGCAKGIALKNPQGDALKNTHWLVGSIEHSSVLECFAEVERLGGKVTHIDPDASGIIKPEIVSQALRPETVFVSVGWGNNEIGIVQPLKEIAKTIHERSQVIFHSDAGQAPLYLSPQVHTLGVDLFSLGSGKLYGPRGVGALYINNRVSLAPVTLGGGQERGLRSGTEEPALAAGFATAFDIIAGERETEAKRLQKMRDDLAAQVVAHIPGVILNTDLKHSLPHMLNISIPNINAEYLVLALDHASLPAGRQGFALSTKSACNEGDASSHFGSPKPRCALRSFTRRMGRRRRVLQ